MANYKWGFCISQPGSSHVEGWYHHPAEWISFNFFSSKKHEQHRSLFFSTVPLALSNLPKNFLKSTTGDMMRMLAPWGDPKPMPIERMCLRLLFQCHETLACPEASPEEDSLASFECKHYLLAKIRHTYSLFIPPIDLGFRSPAIRPPKKEICTSTLSAHCGWLFFANGILWENQDKLY